MVRRGKEQGSTAAAGSGPVLTVTAQQSRYSTDAIDVPATREVLVKDLSISIAQREIIAHAELHLVEGRHYVLIGRNGTGKSTLLRAISEGRVPGIPWSLRVLLLGQTRQTAEEEMQKLTLETNEETVLQHVIRSDSVRERCLKEAETLSTALDSHADPMAPVRAYRRLTHDRLARTVAEARQIAERRSGARGAKARKVLIELEDRLAESRSRLEADLADVAPTELSEDTKRAADMHTEVQSVLEMMDASAAEAKARTVLLGLGFSGESLDDSVSRLSGGWRTRCDLACALFQPADVLLLDEPTNFLDLPSIIWLQEYVKGLSNTTVVMVTHDRDFADEVAEELLVLRNRTLEKFRGNLSSYEAERWKNYRWMSRMKESQDRQKAHMEQTIQGNIKAAKRAGDDKKLRQAASRKKKLDERMGMEVSAKGTRFKLSRDMVGFHTDVRKQIEVPKFDPPAKIAFPASPQDLRFPGALVSMEKVSFSYSRRSPPVLRDVDLTIHPGERVGLCGLNGSGKTTLVSLLMGGSEEGSRSLVPSKGTITRHPRARFGRFSQQAVEEMDGLAAYDRSLTALAHFLEFTRGEVTEKDARGILGSLGLQGQLASDVPILSLSGGQKVRLALAKLVWNPPHLLILDEVTTHLDADTILGLVTALRGYAGALLVITHDRFFMRCVVEGESPYRTRGLGPENASDEDETEDDEDTPSRQGVVYRLAKGQLKRLDGGVGQYEEIAARASTRLLKAAAV